MTHDSSIARALHIADQALGLLRRGELDRARALRQPRAPALLEATETRHLALDIEGALRNRSFDGFTHSDGRPMSRRDVETELFAMHGRGQKLMAMSPDCVGFDDQTGCPGHRKPRLDAPILFVSNDFTTLAGSQIYATRWMEDLARRGLMVGTCDVLQLCARDRAEVARNVAALVTWGDASQTIMRRFFGFSPSPPLVALTGNVADCRRDPGWLADLVVCSTEHALRSATGDAIAPFDRMRTACGLVAINAIVLHPPIAPVYFETPIPPLSERRAVVQVNLSKRPEVFDALARAMPDVPFIAVRGYGEQRIPQLPNVTVLPQAPESPLVAYKQARVLIQPGIESYGLAAAEAAAMGVHVVFNAGAAGAQESLSGSSGLGSEDPVNDWIRAVSEKLSWDWSDEWRRDKLLARQRAELDAAADALARLMGR